MSGTEEGPGNPPCGIFLEFVSRELYENLSTFLPIVLLLILEVRFKHPYLPPCGDWTLTDFAPLSPLLILQILHNFTGLNKTCELVGHRGVPTLKKEAFQSSGCHSGWGYYLLGLLLWLAKGSLGWPLTVTHLVKCLCPSQGILLIVTDSYCCWLLVFQPRKK